MIATKPRPRYCCRTSTALAWANREGLRLADAQAIIDSLVRQGRLVAVTAKGELAYKRADR